MKWIFLTGGTSRRFGSEKVKATLNGMDLLQFATRNLIDNSEDLIVVGPKSDLPARYVREVPEFGGPVAAISAGMHEVDTELVGIFAVDMPFAPRLIDEFKASLVHDAALPRDGEGQTQPLAGLYRSEPLRSALINMGEVNNQSMKNLISYLEVDEVRVSSPELLIDIDTPEQYLLAQELASRFAQ